jgi:glucosylceramidase
MGSVADVVVDQYSTVQVPLRATDRDRDRLAFYATDLPDGVSLDAATGAVTIHPTASGKQDLTFFVTDGVARGQVTVHVTVQPHSTPVGERVEAETYIEQNGWTDGGANFVENNAAASGGKNVGWTAAGNWLKYKVDVAKAGTYDLELRFANGSGAAATDAVSFRDAAGNKVAAMSLPDTGGWGSYQSMHVKVDLPAGDQAVTLFCETGGFNLDYFRLS